MPTLQPKRLPRVVSEAEALITICEGNLAQARVEALHNYQQAQTDDEAALWSGVLEVLTGSARPQA
jgi:hypothetical protein